MAYMYIPEIIKQSGKSVKEIAHFMGLTVNMLNRKIADQEPFSAQEAANLKYVLRAEMSLEELFARKEVGKP